MVYYLKKPSLKWESPYNKEEMGQDNISGQKYTFFYTQDFVSCSKFYATIGWFFFPLVFLQKPLETMVFLVLVRKRSQGYASEETGRPMPATMGRRDFKYGISKTKLEMSRASTATKPLG